jgi:hypothetical protein
LNRLRYLLFAVLIVSSNPTFAGDTAYDRDLVLTVGKAYVQSYLKWHPGPLLSALNWDTAQIKYVPSAAPGVQGYIGVFFPETHGPGGGHAYFEWRARDHIHVVVWGATTALADEVAKFEREAKAGNLPHVDCN